MGGEGEAVRQRGWQLHCKQGYQQLTMSSLKCAQNFGTTSDMHFSLKCSEMKDNTYTGHFASGNLCIHAICSHNY